MKKIMKRAHEIAKTMTGDYMARMSYALRQAWAESKTTANTVEDIVRKIANMTRSEAMAYVSSFQYQITDLAQAKAFKKNARKAMRQVFAAKTLEDVQRDLAARAAKWDAMSTEEKLSVDVERYHRQRDIRNNTITYDNI